MTHSKDIYWPEDASDEMWQSLSDQLLQFDYERGLSLRVPWQGKHTLDYVPFHEVTLCNIPQVALSNTWISSVISDPDRFVIEKLQQSLSYGAVPDVMIPIRLSGVDIARGARRMDFIYPDDPYHVYSINGLGTVWEPNLGEYMVDPFRDGLLYADWLRNHGQTFEGIGSNRISPNGGYVSIPGQSHAGAYQIDRMYQKIEHTHQVMSRLRTYATSTEILWTARVFDSDFGLYISKKPLTLLLQDVYMIAESRLLDIDAVAIFQHASFKRKMHRYGFHFNYHLGNAEMCIMSNSPPVFIKDFETFIAIDKYGRKTKHDTYGYGVEMTPNEAARLFDVMYFLKRSRPRYRNPLESLSLWEYRISAYIFGYFGRERVNEWAISYRPGAFEPFTHPGKTFGQFSENIIDTALRVFENVTLDGSEFLIGENGNTELDDMIRRTVARVWLAIERGENIR